jgi:hypothetical protein
MVLLDCLPTWWSWPCPGVIALLQAVGTLGNEFKGLHRDRTTGQNSGLANACKRFPGAAACDWKEDAEGWSVAASELSVFL